MRRKQRQMKRSSSISSTDGSISQISEVLGDGSQELTPADLIAHSNTSTSALKKRKIGKRKNNVTTIQDGDTDPFNQVPIQPFQAAKHQRLLSNLFNGPAAAGGSIYQMVNDFDDMRPHANSEEKNSMSNTMNRMNQQFYFFNPQLAAMNLPHVRKCFSSLYLYISY